MKKLFLFVLILTNFSLFAQDRNEDSGEYTHRHKRYDKNYFTIGFYTGTYIGKKPVYEKNYFINSVATEIEYFKFSDLSIYIKGLYEFTQTSFYDLMGYYPSSNQTFNEPYTNRIVFSFGGRYYAGSKHSKVNPYLQAGLNQEGSFVDNYSATTTYSGGIVYTSNYHKYYTIRFGLNIGVGFNIKLGKRLNFDMKYDLQKSLSKDDRDWSDHPEGFNAFSVLAGVKYDL
ncbi:MAG: hypothetical protein JST55_00570 [Bacteroidetes bacterium]|nr:hypothetical protein [Bacteroidota bacterium]